MRLNIISRHSLKNHAVFMYRNLYNIIDIVHIYITCFGHAWHYIYHLWISRFSLSMEKLMHALILNETLYYMFIFHFFPMNFYWRKSQMRFFLGNSDFSLKIYNGFTEQTKTWSKNRNSDYSMNIFKENQLFLEIKSFQWKPTYRFHDLQMWKIHDK